MSNETKTVVNNEFKIEGTVLTRYTSLTEVVIPNSVTTIGDWAFSGCPGPSKHPTVGGAECVTLRKDD